MFRTDHPIAWMFHRNTSRWLHNSMETQSAVEGVPRPPIEFPEAEFTPLPRHQQTPLSRLLGQRLSCRRFADDALNLNQLGDLLHVGYGVTGATTFGPFEFLERPIPSGGGLYPLELYCLVRNVTGLTPGIYHYTPVTDGLEQLRETALPTRLITYLFMGQPVAADAAVIIVLTAVVERSLGKYSDRGYRYQLFEAGHVAQNIGLGAAEQGLGVCSLGGFFDDELATLLNINPEDEVALYGIAAGVPAGQDRQHLRAFTDADSRAFPLG
jgi:SagB-type dehydrogenase family enzyme